MSKECFKCGERKSLDEFYRHSGMKDGRLNKCKGCARRDVRQNRTKRLAYYQEYDRVRGGRGGQKYRPARSKVFNAIRAGKIKKQPCVICGDTKAEAHHEDYSRPLLVVWLCRKHHMEHHRVMNEIERNNQRPD